MFPRLRLRVQPVKNSILFWINMRVDDSMEVLVRHASCPLRYGEKIGKLEKISFQIFLRKKLVIPGILHYFKLQINMSVLLFYSVHSMVSEKRSRSLDC